MADFSCHQWPSRYPDSNRDIRDGFYTDAYFNHTRDLVDPGTEVTMQVFQKNHAILGGIEEALAVIRDCSGHWNNEWWKLIERHGGTPKNHQAEWSWGYRHLDIKALPEGSAIEPFEPVLTIAGPYHLFAHLETVYLGILARRTLIRTNVARTVEAANGKPVLYFPARHDHWAVQAGDGYMAHLSGVAGVSTDAQASWWDGKGIGTVPHALIAACDGSTVNAAMKFAHQYGDQMNVSVLVDFDNHCARTAVTVANALKRHNLPLWGVRLDTSERLVDRGLAQLGHNIPGVNVELVHLVRDTLDVSGHEDVKIIVSGGFTVKKIKHFEDLNTPVDVYGVGSSLIRGSNDFTADIVRVNDRACAKVGREETPSTRLETVHDRF